MERWSGKIAVVTGASAGIGLVTAKKLVQEGMIVVGFARRKEKMEKEMENVSGAGKFYARECDVSDEKSIADSFKWVKDTLGTLHVLINNAGISKFAQLEDISANDVKQIVSVNVLGLINCTKEAIKLMKSNQQECHIVNINSLLGHRLPPVAAFNVYPATKYAVTAFTESLPVELRETKIRVSGVSPGLVKTEMAEDIIAKFPTFGNTPGLEAQDVADAIIYILGAPAHVEIDDILLHGKHICS